MKTPSPRPDGQDPSAPVDSAAADGTRCVFVHEARSVGPYCCLRASGRSSRTIGGRPGRRSRVVLWALPLLLGLGLFAARADAQPLETGELTQEESSFLRLVIGRYQLADLGRRWIDDRLKNVSARSRADLEFFRADCLLAEGKSDEYTVELERLRGKFPTHPRAKAAELTVLQSVMYKVLQLHNQALEGGDDRPALLAERDRVYRSEVREPLDRAIKDLEKELEALDEKSEAAQGASPPNPGLVEELLGKKAELGKRLDQWSHYRVTSARVFAERQGEGSEAATRAWTDVLTLATDFVESRWENFILVCECQLIRGSALAELGQVEEAANELDLLVEMRPPLDPPYPPAVVQFIRQLRLQAIEGTARAWNHANQPERAVALFDRVAQNSDPQFPLATAAEDPALIGFVVAARIEEAIARTVVAEDSRGVRQFQALITQWSDPKQANPTAAIGYLLDVSRGLSRLLDLGAGDLPPSLYRHAGTGYQLRGLMDSAILTWRRGLTIASARSEEGALCADMLNQMGQTYYLLDRIPEAGFCFLAVKEMYDTKATEKVRALAAQNSFAVFDRLAARGQAWQAEAQVANEWFRSTARGEIGQLLILEKAADEEAKGNYPRARELFRQIGKEVEGKRSRHYGNAVASAARCLFLHRRAEGKPHEGAQEALAELSAAAQEARAAGDAEARAAIAFQTASIHWDEGARDRDKALAALAPFATDLTGKGDARELALYLWLAILLPEDPAGGPPSAEDLRAADATFAMLARDFPDSSRLPDETARMIEVHTQSPLEQSRSKAADYAEMFTRFPSVKLAELTPPSLLFLAGPLANGGKTALARTLMELAQKQLADSRDVELDVSLTWMLARVLMAEKQSAEAVRVVDELLARHGDDVRSGSVEDSPRVYMIKARALLVMHAERPTAALLQQAEEALGAGLGIFDQRRISARSQGLALPGLEREYWDGWLQLLRVWKAQGRKEDVIKQLRTFEIMRTKFPDELVDPFEQIKKECQ
ncbi:MAG: hypothetical protein AB7O52_15975 [Planctomycetota bacterium]